MAGVFELLRSLEIEAAAGAARGEAFVAADPPLFADHFPARLTLPGSLALELAAQVGGPLAEEALALRHRLERYAVLGMVRGAKFLRPAALPALLEIAARVIRCEPSQVALSVAVRNLGQEILRGELVMAMLEATAEHRPAMDQRAERLARLKAAAPRAKGSG
jgi:3-hydroxymyristoyl/3-hydroxydecanoyl-(acyl carrier protein) dehydratase